MAEHINANDFALVIGINNYPNWNNGNRNLSGPVKDARDFFSWLTDSANGGGIPKENIKLIVSPQQDGDQPKPKPAPIGQDISDALAEIDDAIVMNEIEHPRRLYIFFSGHGHTEKGKPRDSNLCMAPFNDRNRLSDALSLEDILSKATECIAPEEIIVFLDCCRSLVTNAAGVQSTFSCIKASEFSSAVKSAIIYSTLREKLSYESGEENDVRGHFSLALMEGLRGAAFGNGKKTLNSLLGYLQVELPKRAENPKHLQLVDFEFSSILPDEVLLGPETSGEEVVAEKAGTSATANVIIRFSPERKGEFILEDGNLDVVHQGVAESGPWELALGRGRYVLYESADVQNQQSVVVRDVEVAQEILF